MGRALFAIVVCVVFVLIVLLALAITAVTASGRRKPGPTSGGADDDTDRISVEITPPDSHTANGIGAALHKYSLGLSDKDVVGVHNLTRQNYYEAIGGARAKPPAAPLKPWHEYNTWTTLSKDRGAEEQYIKDRAKALRDLQFDWSHVLAAVNPLLNEDREYIGLINPDKDGTTMRVVAVEPSPLKAGEDKNPNVFASVPSELVEKMSSRPAAFIFHTHPSDPRGSPLPSPADVSTAITMGYAGRFAANLVISRYGIIMYTLGWQAYRDIHRAKSPGLAMRNLRYDTAAFLSTIKSWADWTLDEYRRAYERYRLLFVVYPSAEYVAAAHLLTFRSDISSPTDFELLDSLRESIDDYKKGKSSQKDTVKVFRADTASE